MSSLYKFIVSIEVFLKKLLRTYCVPGGTVLDTGALVENPQIRKGLWPCEVLVEREIIDVKQISMCYRTYHQ